MEINFSVPFKISKHFRNTWMRKWACDVHELRIACIEAQKIHKIGKRGKIEIYTRIHDRNVKILASIKYEDEIFIITGAEGHD